MPECVLVLVVCEPNDAVIPHVIHNATRGTQEHKLHHRVVSAGQQDQLSETKAA